MRPGLVRGLLPLTVLVGAALVVGALVFGSRSPDGTDLTVQLTDTTGLYVGNDVQVVGVPVGTVKAIEPHGTRVDVKVRIDADVPVAADTGAVVMQSSLVTDRFIELTEPWTEGAQLHDGAVIPLARTRSPANVDDVLAAVHDLVVALKDTTGAGKDVGDLVAVSAKALDGTGRQIADALDATSDALGTVDGREQDLADVVRDLDSLTTMLAKRDSTVRSLSDSVAASSTLLAEQRKDLTATLESLRRLSATTSAFIRENRSRVSADLDQAAAVLAQATRRKGSIAEVFDVLPTVAENITRAYDPKTRSTRVRVDVRNTGPVSRVGRSELCRVLRVIPDCDAVTNKNGTGALDPLFQWMTDLFPEDL
ncbi:MCE family protein [Aeromicrobium terrae]|uniref:MCE family protein n=1 Tax=Aeromicrobium terrae TaxID=2498846 RepID=UPI001650B25F|nr:MCE family protein [Aeromicrobium terrae]